MEMLLLTATPPVSLAFTGALAAGHSHGPNAHIFGHCLESHEKRRITYGACSQHELPRGDDTYCQFLLVVRPCGTDGVD